MKRLHHEGSVDNLSQDELIGSAEHIITSSQNQFDEDEVKTRQRRGQKRTQQINDDDDEEDYLVQDSQKKKRPRIDEED